MAEEPEGGELDLPDDIRVPTLEVTEPRAREVTGDNFILLDDPSASADAPTDWDRPFQENLVVSTESIRSAESLLLLEAENNIPIYETFKQQVLADGPWFYMTDNPDAGAYQELIEKWVDEPPDLDPNRDISEQIRELVESGDVPPPPEAQQQVDVDHALLRAIGDSYAAIGNFIAMLNDAAQLYWQADLNSKPPTNAVPIE